MKIVINSELGVKVLKLILKKLYLKETRNDFEILFDYINKTHDFHINRLFLKKLLEETLDDGLIEYDGSIYYNLADDGEKIMEELILIR